MKSKYVESKLAYIDSLFRYFSDIELDEELKSHVAKYLTVLISGMYEDMIKNIVKEYIQKETNKKEIKNFIFKKIDISLRNPKHENIKGFLKMFDKDWIKKLDDNLEDENISALDSIVNNKNLIAHGESSTITFENIKKYYEDSKNVIRKIDSLIL